VGGHVVEVRNVGLKVNTGNGTLEEAVLRAAGGVVVMELRRDQKESRIAVLRMKG